MVLWYFNKILLHLGQKSYIYQPMDEQLHFTDLQFLNMYTYNISFIHGSFVQCSTDHWSALHRKWLGQFADCIWHLQQLQNLERKVLQLRS